MKKGAFLISRTLFESEVWNSKPSWWAKIWVYLVGKANHGGQNETSRTPSGISTKNRGGRGWVLTSMRQVYHDCNLQNDGVELSSVKNVFKWLKETTQITTQKTTRGMWVYINNYDKYQNLDNYKNYTENYTGKKIGTPQELHDKQVLNNYKKYKGWNKKFLKADKNERKEMFLKLEMENLTEGELVSLNFNPEWTPAPSSILSKKTYEHLSPSEKKKLTDMITSGTININWAPCPDLPPELLTKFSSIKKQKLLEYQESLKTT